MTLSPDAIVEQINEHIPGLPPEEFLELIRFNWNQKDLSPWDGGYDINEKVREQVCELLRTKFENIDPNYRVILQFLLQQEIYNCSEGECFTSSLELCYDSLASLKYLEDILLLLSANNDTSFDANMGLYKDRIFYNGYDQVMKYLNSLEEIDYTIIEAIEFYAEYFGYKKNN